MVIYEVNIRVKAEILSPYRTWLNQHIQEILQLPGFCGARLWSTAAPDSTHQFVVHYELQDETALANYQTHHAPRLRADGEHRFPGGFQVERRVLLLINSFSGE